MTHYIGDFRTGKTVRSMWNSNAIAGESITRATNGTVSVYKDSSTTQSTTGVTDTEDFDSLTGVHHVAIDTSADGTFYSAGSDFMVVVSAATIDGKTINAVLFQFSLENRSALMPTTDGRKLDVSAGGEAGVDWANIGSPTTSVNLSGTTVKTATDVETDTADIQSRLPAALVSGRIDASVGAMANNVMTAAAAAADLTTELQSGLSTLTQANVRSAVGLASANLDTQIATLATAAALATVDGIVDDILLDTAEIGAAGAGLTNINLPNQTMDIVGNITGNLSGSVGSVTGAVGSVTGNVGGNVTGTIGGLTAAALKDFFDTDSTTDYASAVAGSVVKEIADNAGGSSLTAADIADAVWEEAIADHSGTTGSTAEALNAAGAAGDPWTTVLPGAYGAGSAGKIIGDNINATISSRASASLIGTPAGADVSTDIAAIKTQTAAIETDTQDIQGRLPAALVSGRIDASVGAMAANVITSSATAANYVTEIQSGLATSSSITTLQTSVDDLPTNAELSTALGTADDAVLAAIAALNNLSAAQVNAEVVDALATDTYAEPTGVPAATASLAAKIGRLHQALRNGIDVTATEKTFKDDSAAALWKKSLSDDGTTYTEAEASAP